MDKFQPPLSPQEVADVIGDRFSSIVPLQNGEGGQGVVFKARAVSGDCIDVALKILFPGNITERAEREIEALSRIRCSTLVRLHSSGKIQIRHQNVTFVATGFVEGDPLSTVMLRTATKFRPAEAAKIGADVADAIDALWRERIVHRDVKPDNIMVAPTGSAVLIDLGVARHLSLDSLTALGMTWGTQGYMSPEQGRAFRQLSCKSDIFSLGIILQQMLFGKHPTGYNQVALCAGGPPTASRASTAGPDLLRTIDAMVAFEPQRRPLPSVVSCQLRNISLLQ